MNEITHPDFKKWAQELSDARSAVPASPRYINYLAGELYDIYMKGVTVGQSLERQSVSFKGVF